MNLAEAVDFLGDERGLRYVRWAIFVVLALGLTVCTANGADGPADPQPAEESRVEGFNQEAFTITPLGGEPTEYCALLADNPELRQKGMQQRSDFAGYDGMVFRFDADSTSTFINHFVPIGLSIAWFDANGTYVSAADMEPCPTGQNCPSVAANAPYRLAIEVPKGGLDELGIAPGARLQLTGRCSD